MFVPNMIVNTRGEVKIMQSQEIWKRGLPILSWEAGLVPFFFNLDRLHEQNKASDVFPFLVHTARHPLCMTLLAQPEAAMTATAKWGVWCIQQRKNSSQNFASCQDPAFVINLSFFCSYFTMVSRKGQKLELLPFCAPVNILQYLFYILLVTYI